MRYAHRPDTIHLVYSPHFKSYDCSPLGEDEGADIYMYTLHHITIQLDYLQPTRVLPSRLSVTESLWFCLAVSFYLLPIVVAFPSRPDPTLHARAFLPLSKFFMFAS